MAQVYQSRAEAGQDASMLVANSDYIAPILEAVGEAGYPDDPACLDALEPIDRTRLRYYLLAHRIRIDNQMYQYQQGFIDDEYYENNIKGQIRTFGPGWRLFRLPGRPSFEAEIEKVLGTP